jgi:hypothetical protein
MIESELDRIAEFLDEFGADSDNPIAVLRERFPGLKLVRLDAGEVEGRPVRSAGRFDLYLLDTREHCPVLTDELAAATAVVVVRQKEQGL